MKHNRLIKGIAILLALLLLPAAVAMAESEDMTPEEEIIEEPIEEVFEPPVEEDPFELPVEPEPEEPEPTPEPEESPEETAEPEPTPEPENNDPGQNDGPENNDPSENGEPTEEEEPTEEPEDEPFEEGPEWEITEEELEDYPEATYNFNFQVDTIWESYGDCMFIAVRNAATLISAVNTVNSLGEGTYIIAMAADITMPAAEISLLRFTCGETSIFGCGHTLTLQPIDGAEPGIIVEGADTVLTLGSGVIDDSLMISGGRPAANEDLPSLIEVRGGGTLELYDGVVLENHEAGHGVGGAICAADGLVRMYGGTIRDCGVVGYGDVYGGGVGVEWGGSFYMFGGEVKDCYAMSIDGTSYGGGVAAAPWVGNEYAAYEKAPIQLQGGSISGCIAAYGGGAAFCGFPGAVLLGGTSIRENIAYGPDASSGAGVWSADIDGFALYVYGGCVISDNTYYSSAAYTTGFETAAAAEEASELAGVEADDGSGEPVEEYTGPVRGDALFALTEDARLLACVSDLCAQEDVLRVGVLTGDARVSIADGGETLVAQQTPEEAAANMIDALRAERTDRLDRVQ